MRTRLLLFPGCGLFGHNRERDLRPVSLPVEIQSFRVFRNIICQCHRQEMVPHAPYSRWTFASLLTEFLRLRGQLMRMAP